MTEVTYRLGEMMTKYWCHKSEALKAIVIKTITSFHSGPGFSDTQYITKTNITFSNSEVKKDC